MAADVIYIGESHRLDVTGLTGDGAYLNSATVAYAIKDATGAAVSGGSGTLTYTPASNGNYTGTATGDVTGTLTNGAAYYVEFTAVQGGYKGFRRVRVYASYRGET